ncbi:M23 family metallopeptidase [Nocardia thailandica]|uniref:M23 family metallopeptidase n=2 Tax=Nocardia thailandica TaxID=257275 RepID=A0ABW6PM90_9NOCA
MRQPSSAGHRHRYTDEHATRHDSAPTWSQHESWNSGWSGTEQTWSPTGDEWTPADTSDDYAEGEYYGDYAAAPEPSWNARPERAEPRTEAPRRTERRGGAHRVPAPPAALKGRAAVVAVAAGAVVAAGQAAMADPGKPSATVDYQAAGQIHEIAASSVNHDVEAPGAPQVLDVAGTTARNQFDDMLAKGARYAEDLAAQEAAKYRPLFAKFTTGTFTSTFGARWGVQHLGIDVAAPIGTPIYAVADGTVVEAGPASGFGMWVRLLHDDGTITIYGHIDTATVSQGQRVMAGDQIATVGNRGFSTGPHCHFEVWLNGTDKIDPIPWLATRGISLGVLRD